MEICAIVKKSSSEDFVQLINGLKDSSIVFTTKSVNSIFYLIEGSEETYSFLKLRLGDDAWAR